jgi:hypothetical protein
VKKSILLIGSLFLMLVALQAVADPPAEKTAVQPAVEQPAPAVESQPAADAQPAPATESDQECTSAELLPETGALTEPLPASTCSLFACRSECRQDCAPGCFCIGSCVEDICECNQICF